MPTYNGENVSWDDFVGLGNLINRSREGECSRCGGRENGLILKDHTYDYPMFLCWECFKYGVDNDELFRYIDVGTIIDRPAKCTRCGLFSSIDGFVIWDHNVGNRIVCRQCDHNMLTRTPCPTSGSEDVEDSENLDRYCTYCHNRTNNLIEVNNRSGRPIRVCERCCENGEYLVYSYEYNPEFKFYSTSYDKRTLLYFGIELEIERGEAQKVTAIKSLPSFVYVKRDSSLHDGMEIVSHPMTYRWLKENAAKWEEILNLRKLGWRSFQTDTCGMHIHLSKAAFGNYHLYKFMRMFYNNPNFILYISQRKSSNELRNWASIKDTEQNIIYKAKHKSYGNNNRHTAVNLGRDNSVEIRIFKGTLHSGSFWKNIEFAKAVYDFSYAFPKNKMNEKEFRDFLRYKRKEYPNLYDFMWDEKQFINEE